MVINGLFLVFTVLLTAFLFAPPIALNRINIFYEWFMHTRLVRLFLPRSERDSIEQMTLLDLTAAALNTGMSIPNALRAVEMSLGSDTDTVSVQSFRKSDLKFGKQNSFKPYEQGKRGLDQVAARLLMGAAWEEAWVGVSKRNLVLSNVLAPAWEDGAAPVPLLERTSATLRLTQQSRAEAAASRLGARLVAPLALCFLPAFMLIGVMPILVLAAQQIF